MRGWWIVCLAFASLPLSAQWGRPAPRPIPFDVIEDKPFRFDRFTFARVRYSGLRGDWSWHVDYPESDLNFSLRLAELTTIEINRDEQGNILHAVVGLTEERMFDYPYLYMVEVGYLMLSDPEAQRLREYLLRGGFLLVDDFWGPSEWANWEFEIRKVFPDEAAFPIVDIPLDHEIFHLVFQLDEIPQVPSINAFMRYGGSSDRPGLDPHIRGIFDPNGRLMVVMNHNSDLGDGWERETENFEYFQQYSVGKAYPLGINILVYALTH